MCVSLQFTKLMELLHDMLEQIERQRLAKMVNEIPDHEVLDSRSVAHFSNKNSKQNPVLIKFLLNTLILYWPTDIYLVSLPPKKHHLYI